MESALPGLAGTYKAQVPVKVTNMQLVSGPYIGANWSGTLQFNEDLVAQPEGQRGEKGIFLLKAVLFIC